MVYGVDNNSCFVSLPIYFYILSLQSISGGLAVNRRRTVHCGKFCFLQSSDNCTVQLVQHLSQGCHGYDHLHGHLDGSVKTVVDSCMIAELHACEYYKILAPPTAAVASHS